MWVRGYVYSLIYGAVHLQEEYGILTTGECADPLAVVVHQPRWRSKHTCPL